VTNLFFSQFKPNEGLWRTIESINENFLQTHSDARDRLDVTRTINAYLLALQEMEVPEDLCQTKNEAESELKLFEVGLSWMKQILTESNFDKKQSLCFFETMKMFNILLQTNFDD
jgi:hypothetical protein